MAKSSGSSLRLRLLLLVSLAIVPALGLALWAGLQYRTMVRERVMDDMKRLVMLAASASSETFSDAEVFLRSASTLPQVRNPDRAAASTFLAQLVSPYQAFRLLALVTPNGDIVASSLPMHERVNIRDRKYFLDALQGHRFAVGEYQVGRITHRPGINCAYPVFSPTGEVEGVIFLALDPGQIQRPALQIKLPAGSTLTIVDGQGKVLSRSPDAGDWVGKYVGDKPLMEHVLDTPAPDVLESTGLDGIRRLYAHAFLNGAASRILVFIGEPLEIVSAPAADIMYHNLAALVAVALVALLAGLAGAQVFILRPVNSLVRAARRVGSGDLAARGDLARQPGELGDLARAFDEMTDSLELRERERQLAVDALHSEVEFITAVLGVTDALIAVADREGRVVRANRAHERLTGYSAEEARGKQFWDIFVPEDPEAVQASFLRVREGRFPVRDEAWFRVKNGERHLIAWSITGLLDDQGELQHVIATGHDVTEQRQAEDKLRLDEGRLLALLTLGEMAEASRHEITDFAMEAGVKLTRSTIGYLAFMTEDETVLNMESWSKSAMDECAIIDKPIIYPLETTGLWGEPARQRKPVITNDYATPDPLKKGYPAGHVQVRSHLGIPVFDGDRIVAVAGVGNKEEPYDESDIMQLRLLMDGMWRLLQRKAAAEALQRSYDELDQRVRDRTVELTDANARLTLEVIERQRAEEKIAHQAEELTRSNAELERFAYVASHDLQEPLRKITAFGDRLKTKAGDCLDDDARDYLERMQNAATRMQILINDLLSYARVTTRAQAFVSTNLGDVVREVLTDLEVTLEETGAAVTVGDLPMLQADPVQMRQLFQNLLGNALKFRREGVQPVLAITADVLAPESPDIPEHESGRRYCQILVTDNGIGFEEKFTERVFDVFQRLHSREEYPGTGIGLAICRKIVDRHGGTLTARSTPGKGSTFILTLPLGHANGGSQ